jgi:rod shape determining protein RodA
VSGVGIPSRRYAGPRWGTFAPKRRPLLARAFARGGLARSWDWLLILVAAGLTGLGALLVWAATAPELRAAGQDPHTYLKKQIVWGALGLILMFVVASIDYRKYRKWTPLIYAAALLLLLAVLSPAGQSVNGAKAWIALPGGFQIEPSEFAKLGVILSTAYMLTRRGTRQQLPEEKAGRPGMVDVLLAVLAAAPLIILVEREPALGVMLVLVAVLAGMILVSPIRLYWTGGLILAAAAAIYAVARSHVLKGYQLTRLTSFLHPGQDIAGTGYNALQAKIAVGSGGLHGMGLFHGNQTNGGFVPEQQTDFIFTVAGEELGFVGCAVIVGLLGIVVFRAIRIAARTDDLFGMLVAAGVAIWFLFQSFVNVGMTIGITPITGLPLPFVSYGGSAIFADMIAIGLLQSVRRHHSLFN